LNFFLLQFLALKNVSGDEIDINVYIEEG
jgi:hypothetical protein